MSWMMWVITEAIKQWQVPVSSIVDINHLFRLPQPSRDIKESAKQTMTKTAAYEDNYNCISKQGSVLKF